MEEKGPQSDSPNADRKCQEQRAQWQDFVGREHLVLEAQSAVGRADGQHKCPCAFLHIVKSLLHIFQLLALALTPTHPPSRGLTRPSILRLPALAGDRLRCLLHSFRGMQSDRPCLLVTSAGEIGELVRVRCRRDCKSERVGTPDCPCTQQQGFFI